jgi:AraC-like DNA-binding protein
MAATQPQRWSTLAAAPTRQFAYWRELICEAFLDLTPESELRDGFAGTVTQWPLGELSLARIDSQRQQVRRTDRDIDRGPRAGYYANLQVRGTSLMRQDGRVAVLRPGDIAVVATDQRFAFEFGSDFRQLSLYLPGPLVDARTTGRLRTATRLDTATGVGAAVRHALQALTRSPLAPESAARLAALAGGMLAVALDASAATGHLVNPEPPRPLRSARDHRTALADIEEHLADDDLSPAATARRLGISVRRLHQLFAEQERSYASTVRRLRLEQARRDLQDPARAHLRIADIAAEAGFGNLASFHRTFRREFDQTPAQLRAEPATPD